MRNGPTGLVGTCGGNFDLRFFLDFTEKVFTEVVVVVVVVVENMNHNSMNHHILPHLE